MFISSHVKLICNEDNEYYALNIMICLKKNQKYLYLNKTYFKQNYMLNFQCHAHIYRYTKEMH